MSDKLRAFVLGFTNAFTPIDYSELNKVGDISKRINNKTAKNRKLTSEKINKITTKSGQRESFASAAF
ncbi:hypothetical protein [Sulfurovum sp.]|uniref:hypothetical protein n=1 Tax=Sulfurovum sp. TaxID=1969726 RepID=UPI003562DA84